MKQSFQMELKDAPLTISIGHVAKQANGACLVEHGESTVLVTATASTKPKEGTDFLPLSCDYEEKMYASGKFPGGFNKREGRPSNDAILVSRLMDRPIRPLFPDNFYNSIQVTATVLSYDSAHPTDILAMIGSSIALSISDIPFQGPTGSVRVGYMDGNYIINPSVDEQKESDLNLVVSGTKDAIMMVEAGANLLNEDEILRGILLAHEEIQNIVSFIEEISSQCGRDNMIVEPFEPEESIVSYLRSELFSQIEEALTIADKTEQGHKLNEIKDSFIEKLESQEEIQIDSFLLNVVFEEFTQEAFRNQILVDKVRSDGRSFTEIRPLSSEVGLLPRAHGSGMFTRGQTQALSVVTLGGLSEAQIIDGLDPEFTKRYVHQYNFPSYSVGETRPPRSPGRREIGHGHLAERALLPVLPSVEEFPYAIRVVSEILESNGSSSQASICGSTLSLMDAGVPIKSPVAGIAMGLIKDETETVILTDIQGLEDHYGDMDFKVAGTRDGISALQMDIKIDGVDEEILRKSLEQAKAARLEILDHIHGTIPAVRPELSKYAPLITTITIDPDKIGEVIGSGGRVIQKIIEETGTDIEINDDGLVSILSKDRESGEKAKKIVGDIVTEVKEGDIYTGTVKKIVDFGAFVEIKWGEEGLLHISQIDHKRTNKVSDVLKENDQVQVKVIGVDKGKISLSRKALLPKPTEDKHE